MNLNNCAFKFLELAVIISSVYLLGYGPTFLGENFKLHCVLSSQLNWNGGGHIKYIT